MSPAARLPRSVPPGGSGRRRIGPLLIAILLLIASDARVGAGTGTPVVAAAADLTYALEEIAQRFTEESGSPVRLVFGSSGTLARQILHGAPFDVFLSADEQFVERLADAGLTRDRGVLYAVGRIVVFAPAGSPIRAGDGLDGVRTWLESGARSRFAIANPAHAPYGRAAEAALRAAGLWDRIRPALVYGENVAQAAQFAASGDAAGGIVAWSLVLAPRLSGRGTYALIPSALHPPLRQRMVRLKRAGEAADRFYEYLQAAPARAILARNGFTAPPD